MIQDLGNELEAKTNKLQETLNKEIEDLKIKQAEMQTAITKIKNSLEGTNSRLQETEEQKSKVEDRLVEITDEEEKRGKRLKRNEDKLRELLDNVKHNNIPILYGCQNEKKERKSQRKYLKSFLTWKRNY